MRLIGTGHAGLRVETAAGSVLCDPWVSPAYFASWFPFPDNSGLDWDALGRTDFLYVSHLHRDHFDPATLRRHVDKRATVLLPEFPTDELHDALHDLGFRSFVHTSSGEPVEPDGAGGLRLMVVSLTSPTDGPIGDSALALDDGTARIFNQNDARPADLEEVRAFGAYDAHLLQFSGAIWWPVVYDLKDEAKAVFGRQKRERGMDRARTYVSGVGARHVVPIAGPPCFLDPALRHLNDVDRDPSNIFPDQQVFLDHLREHGHDNGLLLLPGSTVDLSDGAAAVRHPLPDDEVAAIFTRKQDYLDAYAARRADSLAAEKATWDPGDLDLLGTVKKWFEPLLAQADTICTGIGGPVRFDVGDPAAGGEQLVIDFGTREVRAYAGERCRYWFAADRDVVSRLVADRQHDWVNSLFLSLRFRAGRIGPYNEYLYTFFKCLSEERLQYAEGWFAEQGDGGPDLVLGDWRIQGRCPHLKADLSRFGEIEDGVLTCQLHGWRFDLESGACLTAEGYPLRAERVGAPQPLG